MPRRNDIQKILVIGSGPIIIGQSAEFDYSGTQACKALKQEGYEVVLVNSNRNDIQKILVIGSGPIVIGQSAEFDYSGTQACKALKQEGYEVVLVNSNPATIMTDPELADRTYIEPLTHEYVEEIIRIEAEMLAAEARRQAKFALAAHRRRPNRPQPRRRSCRHRCSRPITTSSSSAPSSKPSRKPKTASSSRTRWSASASKCHVPRSSTTCATASTSPASSAFPILIRPSFTLGGTGGGIAYNREELMEILARGLDLSPVHECLVEESVLGWKEFELEVMRDLADNVIIICSIENFDPMGVHTGDSITVAPAQTLTDREYQKMRDAAIAVCAKSASRPAAPMCSSRSIRKTAA